MFVRNAACMQHPAAGGSFDPAFNFLPDPGFDDAATWTVSNANVNTDAPSALRITLRLGSATAPATALLVPGTYHFTANVRPYQAVNGGSAESLKVTVAGTQSGTIGPVAGGTGTVTAVQGDIVVAAVTDQNIKIAGANIISKDLWDMLDATLTRTA